jgi:hypothetical protein
MSAAKSFAGAAPRSSLRPLISRFFERNQSPLVLSNDNECDHIKMRPTPRLMMQATKALRSGAHPDPKNGVYVEAPATLDEPAARQLTPSFNQIHGLVG